MDWSKAKNIIIIFLIVINSMLMFVFVYSNDNNSLTSEREKAIIKLLNKEDIQLQSEIPKNSTPMPMVSLTYKENDIEELKHIFFGTAEDVKRSVEANSTILKKDNRMLTIENSMITYINEGNKDTIKNFDETSAKAIVEQFIKNDLKSKYSKYKFHSTSILNNGYSFKYYETYNGYALYSNYMKFDVTNKGIESIQIDKYEPVGILGIDRDICSADEALLTFIYKMREKKHNESIIIDKIELGYKLEEKLKKSTKGRAIPCYRISIKNNNKIYYINAYTNILIE